MSFGGGGTQAEVAKADRPTIEISIAAKADGVELNIPDNMVARGTEELPMAMDIRGRLLDKNETISEIKVTVDLPDGTTGGMFVSKDRLEELAFQSKLLIDLNNFTSQVDGVITVDKAGIEALKSDNSYNNAFRADGSPKTSWRDLTEQDIKALKALEGDSELQNYATQNGDIYTLSSAVFSGNDALVKPDLAGRFNLSELLFIPPEDLAGSMDAKLSIKTQQGSVVQEHATRQDFEVEISAVADAPTLKDANGNVIDPTVQDYTPPTIEITGIEDDAIRIYNIPVMHFEFSEGSSNTPSVNFLGNDILNVEVFGNPSVGVASDISSLEDALQQSAVTLSNDEEHHYLYGEMDKIKFSFQGNEIAFF